jgi:Asp-tRNA(Asn)/Glu-tRNA(Gln) amidotransferase A subunit family amidase
MMVSLLYSLTLESRLLTDLGVVPPSPACRRALESVVSALRSRGDDVVTITGPENAKPYDLLRIASQLLNSDGGKTFLSHFTSSLEWNDTGVVQLVRYFRLPWIFKRIHAWFVQYIRRDPLRAGLLRDWNEKSVPEQWKLVTERERCREEWFNYWNREDLDFVLSVPHALPAIPENGSSDSVSACGYTFMWNLLDYAAGVMPITKVDKDMDALPDDFRRKDLNGIASAAYKLYDPEAMHGLPVGVQVVGRRLEEEKVLAGMERIEEALGREWDDILMD